jgi:hypothetical protein
MATLWGTPASWLLNRIVTAAPAGTVMREVLNANPFAIRSIMTGPGLGFVGTVVVVAVVAGVPVVVMVGGVVAPAVVSGTVVVVGVLIVVMAVVIGAVGVGVGVTGPFDAHPAIRANKETATSTGIILEYFINRFIVRILH